jgi:spermidine synthase
MDKRLLVNGVGMTVLTPLTKYMAHLPLAFIEGRPQNGLVICFGMGTTFRSMLSWGIHSTSVELIPSVPKLFGFFHPDGPELLKSPLARIVVDDGRRFLERSAEVYDVITLDPPPPLSAPTTSLLFSSEFYEIVKKHLRPRGILHVWLVRGDPGSDLTAQAAIAKALGDSFPHVRAFRSLNDFGFHLLASTTPLPSWDALELTSHLPPMARADLVEWGPYSSAEEMFEKILEQELPLSEIASVKPGVPTIQDDRPINEYFFIRRVFGVNP